MAGLKRRILGIAVISAGVCAALPFRNEADPMPADTREAAEFPGAATSRNELMLRLTIPATPVAEPTTFGGQPPVAAIAKTNPISTPQPQEVRRDEIQAPPSIASAFEPLPATSVVATFPVATAEAKPPTNHDTPAHWHRISDGDELEALAERYLGHRDRWRLIVEANSGLLTDPNILPIGKEILIPQVRRPSQEADADDHLVPIPPGLFSREE